MKIVLVHGFNVRDGGARSVDRLSPGLASHGFTCDKDSADYGWHDLIRVRFFHHSAVVRIAAALQTADAVVFHSNGANYTFQAMKSVRRNIVVIGLSPALNRKARIPACVSRFYVFHTNHDMAVKASVLLRLHPWGDMGAVGYQGHDQRARNFDYTHRICGHSCWFAGVNATYIAGRIADLLERIK